MVCVCVSKVLYEYLGHPDTLSQYFESRGKKMGEKVKKGKEREGE